jgi:hypothetical protein
MSTILQDMMGLISRKKISKPKAGSYMVIAKYQTPQEISKPTPKIDESLILLSDLKTFINGVKSWVILTDEPTVTWNYLLGYNAEITLTGNRVLAEPTNTLDGDYGTLVITQDAVGSRLLTLPASFKVVNGGSGAITLSTTPNAIDSISWVKKGSDFLVTFGGNFT